MIYIGDCEDVIPTLKDTFDFILIDPPYARAGGSVSGRSTAHGASSSVRESDVFWQHWFASKFLAISKVCRPDACGFIFCDYRTIYALENAVARSGWLVSQVVVWDRGSIGMGSPFRAQHEMIAFIRGPKFRWRGRKNIGNVLSFPWPYGRKKHHPAEKPIPLLRFLIQEFCPEDGKILDAFCGSGSAGVAAKAEGRGYVGIERSPDYADVAVARISESRVQLFSDTIARLDEGRWYLMHRGDGGWDTTCIPVASLADLEQRFAVTLGERKMDDIGVYVEIKICQ